MVLTPGGRPLAHLEGLNGHARLPFPQETHFCRESTSVVPLADAFWLEIKSVAQHASGGPAADYSAGLFAEWAADVRKINSDPEVVYAALLVIFFTAGVATARHDRDLWRLRCLEDDLPLLSPAATTGFAICDRLGNAHCSLACSLSSQEQIQTNCFLYSSRRLSTYLFFLRVSFRCEAENL